MSEREILFRISNLVNGFLTFAQAVERIGLLLDREADGKALMVETTKRSFGVLEPVKLLDSLVQPYRSLYTVDLRQGGETSGKATLCFASDHFQGALPERLANFVGQQLGMLLARTRLAERQAQLKTEMQRIEKDLATRKLMQRGEGILVEKCGISPAFAKSWIAQESSKTGLSERAVVNRLMRPINRRYSRQKKRSTIFSWLPGEVSGSGSPLNVVRPQSARQYPRMYCKARAKVSRKPPPPSGGGSGLKGTNATRTRIKSHGRF
jgi:hypothetical protein